VGPQTNRESYWYSVWIAKEYGVEGGSEAIADTTNVCCDLRGLEPEKGWEMHINNAMQSSRRRGVGDILFDSLLGRDSRLLRERSIGDTVTSVKESFSSWDNCMNATYCKYVSSL
jgi:hypothetical protein